MSITRDGILKALSNVDDPDLKKDIVTLGMVKSLEFDEQKISFELELTTPACPMKDLLVNACKNAIRLMVSQTAEVKIQVTSRVTTSRNSAEVLSEVKNIIAVASGKGGVGKSTVAALLALALKRKGASVGLLDADIYGPSVPTLFQAHEAPEMIEKEGKQWMIPQEKIGIKLLSIGMMTKPDQAIVWRGPMISSAFKQFINDVAWGALDYLIIDLPPGTGDVQITLSQAVPLTGVVVVTTPQKVAVADARRAVSMFTMPALNVPVLGILENMSWFTPTDAPNKRYTLFGEGGGEQLASEFALPFLGQLPFLPEIGTQGDQGQLDQGDTIMQAFEIAASEIARQVSIENSKKLGNFASS